MPVTLNPLLAVVLLCDHAILHLDRHFPYGPAHDNRGQVHPYRNRPAPTVSRPLGDLWQEVCCL